MKQNKTLLVLIVTWSLFALSGATCVFGQTLVDSSPQKENPRQKILFSENGRYVFGQISDSSKDQFMLDTVTGRLWRIAETGEIGEFLRAIPYRNEEGETSLVPEKAPE